MIKVKISRPIYIRKGAGRGFESIGTIFPSGKEIEMDGVETGENWKGINQWYFKTNEKQEKQFYWAGGIASAASQVIQDYQRLINFLPQSILATKGNSTTIAIVDNGVNAKPPFFNTDKFQEIDLIPNDNSPKEHGTFIGGIIAGSDSILGISNACSLLSVRFKGAVTSMQSAFENLALALKGVKEIKINDPGIKLIVNLSQGFDEFAVEDFPSHVNAISNLIKEIVERGVPIFCAAGVDIPANNKPLFPSSMSETISVGCISKNFIGNAFSTKVNIVTPLQDYLSFDPSHAIVKKPGSSFSVAFITSIAGLFYSNTTSFNKSAFYDQLKPFQRPIANFDFNNNRYQFNLNLV